LLAFGLPGHQSGLAGLRMVPPNTFLPHAVFSPANRAAMTASSAVAPLPGHSTSAAAESTGPAGAASSLPSLSSSVQHFGVSSCAPDSSASTYVPLPRRKRAPRNCKDQECQSASCPGRTHVSKCPHRRRRLAAAAAARGELSAGSSSTVPPSSLPNAGGGAASLRADADERPPKTPKNR